MAGSQGEIQEVVAALRIWEFHMVAITTQIVEYSKKKWHDFCWPPLEVADFDSACRKGCSLFSIFYLDHSRYLGIGEADRERAAGCTSRVANLKVQASGS